MGAISAKAAPLRRDEALAFIIEHIVRHGFSPTLEEIAQALGGISTARVKELIAQLVKLKAVSKTPGTQRNLRVNDLTACRHHLTEAMRRLRWSAAEAMGDLEAPLPRVPTIAPLPQEKLPRVPTIAHLPDNLAGNAT
jgi:SOS-response transcriptional repressor LexA